MAHFHRVMRSLLWFVVGVLLAAWAVFAHADTYPAQQGAWTGVCAGKSASAGSALAACNAAATLYASGAYCSDQAHTQVGPPTWTDSFILRWSNGSNVGTCNSQSVLTCPYGGSLSGSSCINAPSCPTGQTRDASGQCVNSCVVGGDPSAASGVYTYNGVPLAAFPGWVSPTSTCAGSCSYPLGTCVKGYTDDGVTKMTVCGVLAGTGQSCSSSTSNPAPSGATSSCPPGQAGGTFNGQFLCLPAGQAPGGTSGTTSTSSTAPDPTNGGNSTTNSTTTTVCGGDGACTSTTTTTVTNGAGQQSQTQTQETQPKEDFCAQHPLDKQCKGIESSWGGTCGAFVCDGDAVQCAQAKAEWDLRCSMVSDDHTMSDLGTQVVAGNDPQAQNFPWAAGKVQQETMQGQIDQGRFLASSCVADWSVPMMGSSLTIPFSRWCDALTAMGYVVLTFSLIAAGRIVFGG